MNDNKCPCCGKRITIKARNTRHIGLNGKETIGVFNCQNCNAILGQCYKGTSYNIVRPYFAKEESPQERWQYYDLIVLGGEGIERRHGWCDSETRLILQVG